MNTILLVSMAFALGGIVGLLAGKTSKPASDVSHDTARINYLAETRRWLLYNDQQNAWAVMDTDNKPFAARKELRAAVDAAREKSGG